MRIVWHYAALDEQRTFTIAYRFRGLAVAYDDVVDVNLKVWGDEWKVGARTSSRRRWRSPARPPAPRYRVWGHPHWVHGDVDAARRGRACSARSTSRRTSSSSCASSSRAAC